MAEKELYREVRSFLETAGVQIVFKFRDVSRCIRCGSPQPAMAEEGTPDYLCIKNGSPFFIEVKYTKAHFAFSQIKDHQWTYMLDKAKDVPSWIWLQYGDGRVNSTETPRHVYLVPITVLRDYRVLMDAKGIKSLPLYSIDLKRKVAWDNDFSATTMLTDYRLTWRDGGWIAENHLFAKMHLGEQAGSIIAAPIQRRLV